MALDKRKAVPRDMKNLVRSRGNVGSDTLYRRDVDFLRCLEMVDAAKYYVEQQQAPELEEECYDQKNLVSYEVGALAVPGLVGDLVRL
jgi:hypothetical protein